MARSDGRQKGAQRHAEGAHGQRTHEAIMQQIDSASPPSDQERAARDEGADPGRHRLAEERQQHDEAEKNSEKTREDVHGAGGAGLR